MEARIDGISPGSTIIAWVAEIADMIEALEKMVHFVILNEVKDLKLFRIRDASLRSE
jgi:hypothetical protein